MIGVGRTSQRAWRIRSKGVTKVNIILDTNILPGDWWLQSPNLHVLMDALGRLGGHLNIPRAVLDETVNLYRRALVEAHDKMANANHLMKRVLPDVLFDSLPSEAIAGHVHDYEDELRLMMEALHIHVVEYPEVPHQQVVERLLAGRRPFQSQDKGYRDYLVWMSVLSVLEDVEGTVVFVSRNTKDFADATGVGLHPDLVEELRERGHSDDSVLYFSSLDALIKTELEPRLKGVSVNSLGLLPWLDLKESVSRVVSDTLFDSDIGARKLVRSDEVLIAVGPRETSNERVGDIWQLQSGNISVGFKCDVRLQATVMSMNWSGPMMDRYRIEEMTAVVQGRFLVDLSEQKVLSGSLDTISRVP